MQMTGHKTRSVFEWYNIVSAGGLHDAARRLDTAAGTRVGTSSDGTGTISGTVGQNAPIRRKA
jgi:hypothetical protein